MIKILFITKPFNIEPLGLMYLSAAVNDFAEVKLITTSDNIIDNVSKFSPDIIGYSIITGDQQLYNEWNLKLKNNFKFHSIAGGPHPTFFPEMLQQTSFDAICLGEGEQAFREYVSDPNNPNIANICTKQNKNFVRPLIADLDTINYPDRKFIYHQESLSNNPIKHFITSRGCPYNCTYCFNKSFSDLYSGLGKRVRWRTVDNVIAEIEDVINLYPTKMVYFQDDTFVLRMDWLKQFNLKYKQKIGLPFHCHVRVDFVTDELINVLKDAGCYSVHIAAESGNETVRTKILNRKMTNEQIINAVHKLEESNIRVMLQNMLGLPFTTIDDDLQTLQLNIEAQPTYAWASIFQPYPKTELGEKCIESGLCTEDFSEIGSNFFKTSVLNLPHKNQIINLQRLFAMVVKQPDTYHSGKLQKMLNEPGDSFSDIYASVRKNSDEELYGFILI